MNGAYMKHISKLFLIVALIVFTPFAFTEETSEKDPIFGGIEFEQSCSVCHGFQGRGNGAMADSLKEKPSNLTTLSKRNNGHFPFSRVYQVIEGSTRVGVHGSREMPIWGDRYRKEADHYDADQYLYTRGLILELIVYLMSIQEE